MSSFGGPASFGDLHGVIHEITLPGPRTNDHDHSNVQSLAEMVDRFAEIHPYIKVSVAILRTLAGRYAMDWESVKDRTRDLNSEATIASFLAAVQAQIVAISYQDNSTKIAIATNMLGFAGVLLDVFAACLALLASTILQRRTVIIEKQMDAIGDASRQRVEQIQHLFSSLPHFVVPSNLRRCVEHRASELQNMQPEGVDAHAQRENVVQRFRPEQDMSSIEASFRAVEAVAYLVDTSMLTLFGGILCFFASVQCLAISTQPRAVWIVSAVICSLPLVNQLLGWVMINLPIVFDKNFTRHQRVLRG
ncbi:hypothetical protein C8R45DRAFT_1007030 [Mycena sanguinolenta]|nr:hypothetical protein C8R45DRAFT_1007030 [Mycena sanguinolenta]